MTRKAVAQSAKVERQEIPESDPETIKATTIKPVTYIKPEQAAKYLKVKQSVMKYWRWKKIGPSYLKLGRCVRYNLEELGSFMQKDCL